METKKRSATRRNHPNSPSSSPRPKMLGTNKFQISDDDSARLIGSIIEKGISGDLNPLNQPFAPTAAPKPTVLPFPVARHRSHGPHWSPIGSKRVEEDDEGDDEDDDVAAFDPIAAFANPVQRKERKGLDLTRWRELTKQQSNKGINIADKNDVDISAVETDVQQDLISSMPCTSSGKAVDMEIDDSHQLKEQENGEKLTDNGISKEKFENMGKMDSALQDMLKQREQRTSVSSMVSSSKFNNFEDEQGPMSLESEIDAENRARLERMSPEEIAQAQAEIMEKMDPALLNMLKKRGQDKTKRQKFLSSDQATNGELGNAQSENQSIQDAKVSPHLDSGSSDKVTKAMANERLSGVDGGVQQNLGPENGSLWSVWSERVEAVRELRFSLDGTVIAKDNVHVSDTGSLSVHNRNTVDNVVERDFLRTEGDPGAEGYTIKEAVDLSRSLFPGQRTLALHLLASVLDKAIHYIHENQVGYSMKDSNKVESSTDWKAIWAFALGPEPELVLSLRMSLDDNHSSVILACAKVFQCILSCKLNEKFFDVSERIATYDTDIYIAPVFRSKPAMDVGFLHGGFWKYNAKPSNILSFGDDVMDSETEGNQTIQDDVVVAGQDVAAGLVRMGVLPRIRYLLETEPAAALEECIISILIAIARHSPTCANVIMRCERLIQTVVHRFTMKDTMEVHPSKIKSVTLLKVLVRSDKRNCVEFIKSGVFQAMTWHLFQPVSSLDNWVKSGTENCKLSSALVVEQLRFWKVCIQNGYGISYFPDIFPALCLWLNPPSFEKLVGNNVLNEFAIISNEAYLVLETLARKLPNIYSQRRSSNRIPECAGDDMETWSWSYVDPMVDLAVKWISLTSDPHTPKFFKWQKGIRSDFFFDNLSVTPLLWVYSSIMHMLFRVLKRVNPEDNISLHGSVGHVPWLPEFVPKIGLAIVKNRFLSFVDANCTEYGRDFSEAGSFVEELCHLRQHGEYDLSLASVCCLHGVVKVVYSLNNLIMLAKSGIHSSTPRASSLLREEVILEDGILKGSMVELRPVLNAFMKLVASEWNVLQSIEVFGRGGPAPGVGVGWGASGGGFWSATVLLAQIDAGLLIHLLEIFGMVSVTELQTDEDMAFSMVKINSALGICLTAGPRERIAVEKVVDMLLQVPVLKYLDLCIRRFLQIKKRMKLFGWNYTEEDYLHFSETLASHFKNRWFCVKRKSKHVEWGTCLNTKTLRKGSAPLDTIHEELDVSGQDHYYTSLTVEWAHQRLPLPTHWFLSPFSTISAGKNDGLARASNKQNLWQDRGDIIEVAKCGLFFLLGIEAMSTFLSTEVCSPVQYVPLIWKVHSLSVVLFAGMEVLEDEKSRDVYEALQKFYGQLLDEARSGGIAEAGLERSENLLAGTGNKCNVEFLRFQSEIHESYCTFIETFVEQFAAISYGDLIYGRQVVVYLHRSVEAPVRLATWNALSNAHVLELLPPLEKCFAEAEGYLEPFEDNESILEAYLKSWVSGALDKAAKRGSMAFTLVLHHLSSFIFLVHVEDKLSLKNKLVKSLLRDYSRRQQHERMMMDLIQYNEPFASQMPEQKERSSLQRIDFERRFNVLMEACDGNSSLLTAVEKLKSSFVK